jgi:hypothetical protein
MSTMQTPPPLQSRQMPPIAVNTIIASLLTIAGIALIVIAGAFIVLASYIIRNALMTVPWRSEIRDEINIYMALAIIPSLCAIVTFIFGLKIVAKGLGRLMQQGTSAGPGASKPII